MSTIKHLEILYFASLAKSAGKDEDRMTFDGHSLTELYQFLTDKYQFKLPQQKIAVAINHEITNWNAPLQDGDVVAFIPPVAGGYHDFLTSNLIQNSSKRRRSLPNCY